MVTARIKFNGPVTFDQWRQTRLALEGKKPAKRAITTAEKYVKKNNLGHLIHRTSAAGFIFGISLDTGEEIKFKLVYSSDTKSKLYSQCITDHKHSVDLWSLQIVGVDPTMQKKLLAKFPRYEFSIEEIIYCHENVEFTDRLLSSEVSEDKLVGSSYLYGREKGGVVRPWGYTVTIEQLVTYPALFELLPHESGYKPPDDLTHCSVEIQQVINEHILVDLKAESKRLVTAYRGNVDKIDLYMRSYAVTLIREYLAWGDLLNRQVVTVDDFNLVKESERDCE